MLICVYVRCIKRFYCIVYLVLFSMPRYFYVVFFRLCCLLPSLGPPATLRYVTYFGFVDDIMFIVDRI